MIVYASLGLIHEVCGEFDQAERMHEQSLVTFKELGQNELIVEVCTVVGAGCEERAKSIIEQLFSLQEECELDRKKQEVPFVKMGKPLNELDQQVLDKLDQVLDKLNQSTLKYCQGLVLVGGLRGLEPAGTIRKGIEGNYEMYARECLSIVERFVCRRGERTADIMEREADIYADMGGILLLECAVEGAVKEAEQMLLKSLSINQELERKDGITMVHFVLFIVYLMLGELHKTPKIDRDTIDFGNATTFICGLVFETLLAKHYADYLVNLAKK